MFSPVTQNNNACHYRLNAVPAIRWLRSVEKQLAAVAPRGLIDKSEPAYDGWLFMFLIRFLAFIYRSFHVSYIPDFYAFGTTYLYAS